MRIGWARALSKDRKAVFCASPRLLVLIWSTIDKGAAPPYTSDMEISLSPDLQSKLAQIAAECGRDPQTLATEAIERFVDYDAWFVSEVEKGLTQIDRDELLTREEVGARLEKLLAQKQRRG